MAESVASSKPDFSDDIVTARELLDFYTDQVDYLSENPELGEKPKPWREVLDNILPRNVRRLHPRHEFDSLLIKGWTARRSIVKGSECKPHEADWRLARANDTLLNYLINRMELPDANDDEDERHRLHWHAQAHVTPSQFHKGFPLRDFFSAFDACPKSIHQRFLSALLHAPSLIIGRSVVELNREYIDSQEVLEDGVEPKPLALFRFDDSKESFKEITDETEKPCDVVVFMEIFELGGKTKIKLGARAHRPQGIAMPVDKRKGGFKWFDFFGVWHFEVPLNKDKKIKWDAFDAVQGIFVPVDQRHLITESEARLAATSYVAALAARNMSHNLGSHALLQVAGDLHRRSQLLSEFDQELEETTKQDAEKRNCELLSAEQVAERLIRDNNVAAIAKLIENGKVAAQRSGKVAQFLDYLTIRSELIAMLASGSIYSFATSYSLKMAIENFSSQQLLLEHLCSPRFKCEVTLIESGDDVNIDLRGGELGVHALYAVLENHARNSAKHARRADPETTKLALEVSCEILTDEASWALLKITDTNSERLSKDQADDVVKRMRSFAAFEFDKMSEVSATADEGQGVREMKAWAIYLAHEEFFRDEKQRTEPRNDLLDFGHDDGRLWASVRIPVAKPLEFSNVQQSLVTGRSHETNRVSSSFRLIEMETQDELKTKANSSSTGYIVGRWLALSKADKLASCPFGAVSDELAELLVNVNRESTIHQQTLAVQSAWIDSLKRYAMADLGADQPLHLLVIDSARFGCLRMKHEGFGDCFEVDVPHLRGVRLHIATEEIAGEALLTKPELQDGYLAVWDRHDSLKKNNVIYETAIKERMVHYEQDCSSSAYSSLFENLTGSTDVSQWMYGVLAEAALTRVLIVDERLAEVYRNDSATRNRAENAGIVLWDPFDRRWYDDWPRQLTEVPRHEDAFLAQAKLRFAYKSIHRSLNRDQVFLSWKKSTGENWDQLLDRLGPATPYISEHSGRGGGAAIGSPQFPVFTLSLLKPYAFDNPCKAVLTEALYRGGHTRP